jgi:hypothetical protein
VKRLFTDQGYILIESLISIILLGLISGIIVMFFTGLFKSNSVNRKFDVFPEIQKEIRYCRSNDNLGDTSYTWDRFIIQKKVKTNTKELIFSVKAALKNDTTEILGLTFYKHNETL